MNVLLAIEATLLVCLLLLASWLFSEWASPAGTSESSGMTGLTQKVPSFGTSDLMLGVFVCTGLYGLLQFFSRSNLAFWSVAFLALLPQAPGIWFHNNLQWQRFIGVEVSISDGQPLALTAALFLVCLAGLIALHRVIALRKLGRLLALRRVDRAERDRVLMSEGLTQAGVAAAGLMLALLLVTAGMALGRSEWMSAKVPWTVITIGGGASLLLVGFTVLFLRSIGETGEAELPVDE